MCVSLVNHIAHGLVSDNPSGKCTTDKDCEVTGETCVDDTCKCGTSVSCKGNDMGNICEIDNRGKGQCVCTKEKASCSNGAKCNNGRCGK